MQLNHNAKASDIYEMSSNNDGLIVAAHDIAGLRDMLDHPTIAPDIKFDVQNGLVFFENYSLLKAVDINALFKEHENVWLVTD